MSDPHSNKNARTCLGVSFASMDSAFLMEHSFRLAEEQLLRSTQKGAHGVSVAVIHMNSGQVEVGSVVFEKNDPIVSLVIGRHEAADFPMVNDSSLSLRHTMILLAGDEENGTISRIIDLRSGTGMIDHLDVSHYSVASNGPLAMRVGDTTLFIVPWKDWPYDAPKNKVYNCIHWPDPKPWRQKLAPERQMSEESVIHGTSSVISMVSGGTGLGFPRRNKLKGPRVGRLKFEAKDYSSTLEIDDYSLRTGVLVGRYPRCNLVTPSSSDNDKVSRVHAMFMFVDDKVHVFETGSTNGLSFNEFEVTAMALPEYHPSRFDIADDISITWWPG